MSTPEEPVVLRPIKTPRTAKKRKRNPKPELRSEADRVYGPTDPTARARGARLDRLNAFGLLVLVTTAGDPITTGQAHEALSDVMYDEHGRLRDVPTQAIRAEGVQ